MRSREARDTAIRTLGLRALCKALCNINYEKRLADLREQHVDLLGYVNMERDISSQA
jgi:hypothetical protein